MNSTVVYVFIIHFNLIKLIISIVIEFFNNIINIKKVDRHCCTIHYPQHTVNMW
jgi:hypothetical protein